MKIDIQAKNINLKEPLHELIMKKVGKLSNFHSELLDTSVYLRAEGESVENKEVQIKLNVKNQTLIAKERAETFEKALESTVESMKRQIKKYKQK